MYLGEERSYEGFISVIDAIFTFFENDFDYE